MLKAIFMFPIFLASAIIIRSVLMQKELDAYRESLIHTGKACKLDVKQLRYELRQVQAENELLKKNMN